MNAKKSQNPHQLIGFSLIELMLVLAIIATIVFIGINRYQQYRLNTDIQIVKQNVNLLFNSLNIYYSQYCNKDSPFSVSMDDLKTKNLLPELTKTKLLTTDTNGYQYSVSAAKSGDVRSPTGNIVRPIYTLYVMATPKIPPGTNTLTLYQQLLAASTSTPSNGQLTWSRLPTYTVPTMSSQLWMMRSGLNYFKEYVTQRSQISADTSCAFQ